MDQTARPPTVTPPTAPGTYEASLSRSIGVGGNILITLSSISPASSVFILGGAALAMFGTGVFWAFLVAGIVSILIAFCYAELASAYPVAGGDYSLVSRALGPAFGVATFFISLISLPLIIAVFALGVADYLGVAIHGLSPQQTALVVVVITTVTACFDIRTNAWLTGVFLGVEMAALALLTVLGFVHMERPLTSLLSPEVLDPSTGQLAPLAISGLMLAVTQGIFAYNGYGGAVYFAEETKNAARSIAKAVIWSAVITVATELVPLIAIMVGARSQTALFNSSLPVEAFLTERAGHAVAMVVLLSIALAVINAIIAITLQAGRLLYAAARDRALPQTIAVPLQAVSTKGRVPVLATVVMGAIAFAACFVPLDVLLTATGSTLTFTYLFIALAAINHRRGDTDRPGYRMPLWPLAPGICIAALGLVFVVTLLDPEQWLSLGISLGLVAAGFAYYALYLRPRKNTHLLLLNAAPEETPLMLDLLLTNGVVRTFDTPGWAEAVGVADGRIRYVGTTEDAPAARRTIDLRGRLLTPGIIDSHNHLLLGFDPDAVSLEGAHDLPEVRRRIAAHAAARPDLDWICAENAVYSVVSGRRPNADDLRGLTDRPVFITTYDQHSVWLNDAALRVLGIDRGTQIPWGRPEFDADGAPTGWVTDFYTSAMTRSGLAGLQRDIPMYSPDRRYCRITSSLEMATASGITTVVEPQVPLAELDLMYRARGEGRMHSRVITALFHPVGADAAFRRDLREAVDGAPVDDMLRLGPVKLYADDVIEPHTAAMLSEYANRPGHRGAPSLPPREFTAMLTELDRLGFQTHTHATGDWGIRLALDSIEHAGRVNGTVDRRHGIVHVECLHPDDLPRFRDLGVVAAMQPRHCSPDLVAGTWMENVGEDRWDRAWRFRSLAESGAALAFSSDWQVGEMDPLVGLYSALTRSGLDGGTDWTPNERMDLDSALRAYTRGGAWAWHAEDELGVIRPGARADLVVWSANLYTLEPGHLLDQRADLTLVGGAIVHDADADASTGADVPFAGSGAAGHTCSHG